MAEVVSNPLIRNDEDLTGLVRAVRVVVDMVQAVEAKVPHLLLGADRLAEAAAMVAVLSIGVADGEAVADLAGAARSTAAALAAELARTRETASKATAALAATVPLPGSKEMQLLGRYRRDLERRLESELRVLVAVRERKVHVVGTSGLLGQPIPIRLVG